MTIREPTLEKVTVFITRPGVHGPELLLIRHPHAGLQLPAGTVEPGESPADAALREAWEETGLADLGIHRALGQQIQRPGGSIRYVLADTTVYSRPDPASFDWAHLRRGLQVREEQRQVNWVQVTFEEPLSLDQADVITYRIMGWVPAATICAAQRRHFFHLIGGVDLPDQPPPVFTDFHHFQPFWARQTSLPEIVAPQQGWLDYLWGLNITSSG